jgi:hypothetical protein
MDPSFWVIMPIFGLIVLALGIFTGKKRFRLPEKRRR